MSPGESNSNQEKESEKVFDPYKLLDVPYDATNAGITSAFRKSSLRVHPDRCPDDSEATVRFRELVAAKDFLLDPFKRRMYNLRNGLIVKTQNVIWWSDWDDIFAEIGDFENDYVIPSMLTEPPKPLSEARTNILIFGATGLTGMLACMAMHRDHRQFTWSIAGRDGRKLERLKAKFGRGIFFRGTFQIKGDADLEHVVRSAEVVVDLSGPSPLVGLGVAKACTQAGTHLIDNTVDVVFSKQVQEQLHDQARNAGVCLVYHVGYNSLLVDFGVWHVVRHLRAKHKRFTRRVDAYAHVRGFVRSGTSNLSAVQNNEDALSTHGPFMLGGARKSGIRPEDHDLKGERYFKDYHGGMIAELDVNKTDRMVVRCSCGQMDDIEPYGDNFMFKNWTLFKDEQAADMAQFYSALMKKRYKNLVEEGKLPPPGAGPKERIRQETFVTRILVATAELTEDEEHPRQAYCVVNCGPGGVGDRYEGTAVMGIESACTLLDAINAGGVTLRPGFGTPVGHMAHLGLLERLTARGFHFKLVDESPTREFFRNVTESTMPIEV